MQSIEFIGHLTADPTVKSTQSGTQVATFTVGVTRTFKNAQGDRVSDFFRVNAWRQQAEYCSKYLTRGARVYVRGELQPNTYEGKDGKTRISLDVQADRVENLTEKLKEQKPEKLLEEFADITSKDIPF